jgi:hypothetical protein
LSLIVRSIVRTIDSLLNWPGNYSSLDTTGESHTG